MMLIAVISLALGQRLRWWLDTDVHGDTFCCIVQNHPKLTGAPWNAGWCNWGMLISLLDEACTLQCIAFVCCPFLRTKLMLISVSEYKCVEPRCTRVHEEEMDRSVCVHACLFAFMHATLWGST